MITTMKILSCFFLFWLIVLVTSGQNVCEPVEEGSSYTLTCNINGKYKHYYHFEWVLEDGDGHYTTVAYCFDDMFCDVFNREFYDATVQGGESTLTIKNVSRIDDVKSEGRWICGHQSIVVCDRLEVFVKPENPVCDNPVLLDLQTYISITCKTDNVYPQAGCHFLGSWDINQNVSISLEERIYYIHTAKNETPVYYKSECTLEVPVSSLALSYGENIFKVLMFPNVSDGSRFGVESNVVTFNLAHPPKGKFYDKESDDSTIIGLSVTVVIITIVAVVLGVYMIYYKKKYRNMSNRKMAPGYDEVDRAQSDQVNSYEATGDHDTERFTMTSPRDVQQQEETQTRDGIYEDMEDDSRPPKTEGGSVYVNQKSFK